MRLRIWSIRSGLFVILLVTFLLVCITFSFVHGTQLSHAGGADTSVSGMNTFILMMVCHPEIQAKAQEELDRVLGKDVLPSFEDEPSLPYMDALVKEILRYVSRLSFAYRSCG